MADDDWTPVLRPDGTYCSRRCGRGCLKSEFDAAVREASELAAKVGEGWEPHVCENSGWHYRVEKGVAAIYPNRDFWARQPDGVVPVTGYTAYINSGCQFICKAEAPEDAIGFATQEARTFIARVSGDLADLIGEADHG